jgi:hypothetical protein
MKVIINCVITFAHDNTTFVIYQPLDVELSAYLSNNCQLMNILLDLLK